jgi:transposase
MFSSGLLADTDAQGHPVPSVNDLETSRGSCLRKQRRCVSLRPFYDRLRADGKSPKEALVGCMRKLLTILNAIVRDQTPWQPASVHP